MKIVSQAEPLMHYRWGAGCDGWNLVDEPAMSVKLERMPPHSAEEWHLHNQAQQFFFILGGEAIFEIEQQRIRVPARSGIHVPAGNRHRIMNEGDSDLEFLLSSQPSTADDRIMVDKVNTGNEK